MDSTTGGPEEPRDGGRRLPPRRGLVASVVVAVGLAAAATGVAMAADGSSAPSPSPSASDEGRGGDGAPGLRGHRDGDGRDFRPGHGLGMFGFPGAVHGEFVVPDPDGGYRTLHSQRGEVTAVSTSSITVRSEDDYSKTYAVTADTLVNAARDGIDTVEKGDDVAVLAIEEGGDTTAVQIGDLSRFRELRERFGPRSGSGDEPAVPEGGSTTETSGTLLRGV